MRISTHQVFDAGATNMLKNQSSLYKQQNQLATGRRVLTPQDDPVAAARALEVDQSISVNQQYIEAQGQAKNQLGLVDTQLSALNNALLNVRDRVVQAGNTTLSNNDRQAIASELEARLGEILSVANSDNGSGEFLFSGYSGKVKPFAIDGTQAAIAPATQQPVAYYGDSGERTLQVSASRLMGVNVAGDDLFQRVRNGNGTFVTSTGGNLAANGAPPPAFNSTGNNQGLALIDKGSVLDAGKWANTANPDNFMIRFSVTKDSSGNVTATTYQLYDNTDPAAPVELLATPATYTPGQAIPLQNTTGGPTVSFGAQVTISGQPEDGDSFTIAPSSSQSIFQTVQNVLGILRSPIGSTTYTTTQYSNELAAELTNIDQALENVSRIQSAVGTKQQEIESLGSSSSDLAIQYKSELSDLQDLDWNKAISDFMQQKMNLEAAQSSFAKISGLSLFNYL